MRVGSSALSFFVVVVAAGTSGAALVAHWPFSEGTGTVVGDAYGGIDGAFGGSGNAWITDAKVGPYALRLNGNGWVTMGNPVNLQFDTPDPFTMAAWVRGTNFGDSAIMGKMQSGGNYTGYELHMSSTAGAGRANVWLINQWPSPQRVVEKNSTVPVQDGAWHHVAFTYDGSGQGAGVNVYIDGVLDSAATVGKDTLGGNSFLNTAHSFNLGARQDGAAHRFAGDLDDAAVWGEALTAETIRALYNLANWGPLNYDAAQAQQLFDVYAGGPGSEGTVGGHTWRHVTGLDIADPPGAVLQGDGWYTLVLGGDPGQRTGVQAGSPPVWSATVPIPIGNFSFEAPVVPAGTHIRSIDDWTHSSEGTGVFRGAGEFGQAAAPTHGVQMAYLNEEYGQMFQTLTGTYEAGKHYSLLVDVSARAPQIAADDFLMALFSGTIAGLPDLNPGNTVRTGTYRMATGVANDEFRTMVLSVTADQIAAAGAAGQPIGIGFFGNGGNRNTGTSDYDLDNVCLYAVDRLPRLPNPAIIGRGSEHSPDYAAENVFDGDYSGAFGSEYSSAAGGTSFIEFDFGSAVPLFGFEFAQRGNNNDALYGFSLTFSDVPTFDDATTYYFSPTNFADGSSSTLETFVFPEQVARYVRWEAQGGNSAYRGAAEMGFLGVPEPSSLVLAWLALVCLGWGRRLRSAAGRKGTPATSCRTWSRPKPPGIRN